MSSTSYKMATFTLCDPGSYILYWELTAEAITWHWTYFLFRKGH